MIAHRVLGLHRGDGSLEEDLANIQGMFSDHFQNIFCPYLLTDTMVTPIYSCYKVVPNKVSVVDHDRLDRYFTEEELFAALSSVNNGKSHGLDGIPCEFYKVIWDTIGDDFCHMTSEAFSVGCLS